MNYVKPADVLHAMIAAGEAKARLSPRQMMLRGALAGAILACATTLAFTAASQTGLGVAGAVLFPAGFVIIVLLGLELVTGSFALIPLSVLEKKTTYAAMLANYTWVIVGHLLGCAAYAALYTLSVTKIGTDMDNPLAVALIQASEAKTILYKQMGSEGMLLVGIKAVLCNWMVTLGAVMALTSSSATGKIVAMWLPIMTFFAQGFEHAVVNMFVIPAGMLLGANVTVADWWLWNQLPVLIGNFIGGVLFTGVLFYVSQKGSSRPATPSASAGVESAPADRSA